jgi:magnesium transporter
MLGTIFSKRHPHIGASPGTLVISDESPPPRIRLMSYAEGRLEEHEIDDLEHLHKAHDDETISWIDVQGFGDQSAIRTIGEVFQLHPLLLEDLVNAPQRPKSEAYGDQLLIIVRMVKIDRPDQIDMEQVSVVLGKNYVLTFQERYGDVLDPVRKRIRARKGRMYTHGADYLAYAIVDTIIDAYYPVLEIVGDHLESLEDEVITNPTPQLLGQLHRLKNRLVNLRRGVWPLRDAISALVRGDFTNISEEVRMYVRDTYDHCVQTSEVVEMYREMVASLMNTYLSAVANRTNEVMKVLTIVATIFIPLTFLAGIYGMNFEYMPELHVRWAYPLIWIAMIAVAAGMLVFFWRKGWLGGKDSGDGT